ncbi:MAG: beta strand repeat-containing protein [Phycisphaerae bacterium]
MNAIQRNTRKNRRRNSPTHIEPLEQRTYRSVAALALPGVLTVRGDVQNNTIVVSRDPAGKILVNGGAVKIVGFTPTVANTKLILLFGADGNDTLSLDEANGALPVAELFGGNGNDLLTGGSSNDLLFGQAGNDTLLGKGGNDLLFGGAGDDSLTGGAGNDQVFGEANNDTLIWNPGDATDLNEGGDGIDTIQVNGGNGAETFTATPNGSRVRFDRTTPAPFSLDIGSSENLVVNMNGGDDTFTGSNGLSTLINLTVDGGTGNDTITGGDGNDLLLGGDGNDLLVGGRGNDTMLAGANDDTFVWNPGDGSDTLEGQAGNDTLQFNGANINEKIDISANGSRVRFTRDVAAITMDANATENINFKALGGADSISVGDLTGTGVTALNFDLGAATGGGDAAADTLTLNGTNYADNVQVSGAGTSYAVTGLPATVNVANSEGALDNLVVQLQAGNDTFSAAALPALITRLTVDAGAGQDILVGSQGDDLLLGGDDADSITGGRGNDTALMGAGDDTFLWNPGDGSDVVEGQAGTDTLVFNGANINENFDLSANGSRLRLSRDVGAVVMDTNALEQINLNTLAGADAVTVNDLTGTGLQTVNLNLGASNAAPDAATDNVIVNGTAAADNVVVASSVSGGVKIGGLAARINITLPDPTDNLTVNSLAGADTIDASLLQAGAMLLTENGGDDADLLVGSQGDDTLNGGRGNDVALGGAGDDTFVWNPGDGSDTLEGQAGNDTLQFNGANIAENINISANGSRVRFTRDVAAITMDLNGTENINFKALGGADAITVGDLTGTDVTNVNLDLAATGGAGDGAADTVTVNGTAGADTIQLAGDASGVQVLGLQAQVNITGAEPASDRLIVQALAGDDVIEASALAPGAIQLTEDGGDNDDVLIGTTGNDTLLGGNGDDVLIGNGGIDILNGGPGSNTIIP